MRNIYEILDNLKFNIGDVVYIKTDPNQHANMVTAITLRQFGVTYGVSFNGDVTWLFDFEISHEPNEVLKFR